MSDQDKCTWHFYDAAGAPMHRSFFGLKQFLAANTPEGCEAREDAPEPLPEPPGMSEQTKLLAKIHILEARGTRAQREFALGYDGARQRLQEIDDEIAKLRTQLAT